MSTDETEPHAEGQASPGWYPDPWFRGQRRYWDGQSWTAHSFPEDPVPAGRSEAGSRYQVDTPLPPPTVGVPGAGPPPPDWWAPPSSSQPEGPPPRPETTYPTAGSQPLWPPRGKTLVAMLLALGFIVGLIGGALLTHHQPSQASAPPPVTNSPAPGASTPPPTPSSDPSSSVLSGLVLQQSDVKPTETVNPINGGTQVAGQTTLDLCNGTYPSEALRSARLQVAGVDNQGNLVLSTEAVLYATPAAGAQAMAELKSAVAGCPQSSPVISPVGEPTVTTRFNAAPDASWPQVPNVERQAYDFVTTDTLGQQEHMTAVYLRRGRALMGLYFSSPDGPQPPVDGQTTIPGIVNLFATRMANLPSTTVNG